MRSIAEWLLIKILLIKGEKEMMAMLFAIRITRGKTEFEDVPAKLKEQVAEILLNDYSRPDLVTVEFGGTLA